jgi:hypothetical protein
MELYNVRNIAEQGIERGDPGEKTVTRMVNIKRNEIVKDFKQCLDN